MILDDLKKELQKFTSELSSLWEAEDNAISKLDDDMKKRLLGATLPEDYKPAPFTEKKTVQLADLPRSIDWRNNNGNFVTPVGQQGLCGCCVGFGTAAAMESRIAIEHGKLLKLSVADSYFCSSHGANCNGWWPANAYAINLFRGICPDAYFPYHTAFPGNTQWDFPPDPHCKTTPDRDQYAYKYKRIHTVSTIEESKDYLVHNGPLAAVMDVSLDFYFYRSGIYRRVIDVPMGEHCVTIIGYSDEDGGYWIGKNSWGDLWGDDGFFKIAYGQCNIDHYEKVAVTEITLPEKHP